MRARITLMVVAALLSFAVLAGAAAAQPYVGVYLSGVPSSEHEVKAHRTIVTTGVTDRFTADADFGSSIVYGGVVGYQFLKFLAGEVDVYRLSPGIEAQTKTAVSPTIGTLAVTTQEGDLDITILALSAVGTYSLLPDDGVREGRLQLYGGAGLGIFFSDVDVQGVSGFATARVRDSDTSVGPHVKLGARWFFTRNLAAFLEFRYSHTSIHVSAGGTAGGGTPIRLRLHTTADIPLALVGASWTFR